MSPSEALACSSSTSGPYPTLMFGPLVLMISFAVSIASSSSSSWFYVVNVHSSWDKGICCFKCSIKCNLKCAHYCSILTSSPKKIKFKLRHQDFELIRKPRIVTLKYFPIDDYKNLHHLHSARAKKPPALVFQAFRI